MNTIRKLGIKKIVFLSIFGLVALAYIASPLVALAACPGAANNQGGNQGNVLRLAARGGPRRKNKNNNNNDNNNNNNNDNNNNNVKKIKKVKKGNNNNNNNDNNNDNNNNNNDNNKGQTLLRSKIANSTLLIGNSRILAGSIESLQLVDTKDQPITLAQYQNDIRTAGNKKIDVRAELLLQNNQPGVFTQGLFGTTDSGGQQISEVTVKANGQITLLAESNITDASVDNQTITIPLQVPN
jgi:hypothetical protein